MATVSRRPERHPRDRAAAVARQEVERSAVQPRDAVDDGEPQSRTRHARRVRARRRSARERLLQPLDLVRRDARAAVGDVEHDVAVVAVRVVTSTGGAP